jgi:dolichol-phosphate mannosyltransferase
LQDPPEVISQMIEKWKEGFNIVYARRGKRNDKFLKKYSAIIYYKVLYRFSETKIPRDVGDFRLIDRKVLNEINKMKEKSRYLRGMVAWVGFRHTFVDFDRPERQRGQTNYTLKKMIVLSMDGLINFSSLPLKLGLFLGGAAITFGFLFLLYMAIDIIINNVNYPLYKWLIVILFIFIGFIFVLIWLLGEYVSRIYNESKDRPYYIINEKENF